MIDKSKAFDINLQLFGLFDPENPPGTENPLFAEELEQRAEEAELTPTADTEQDNLDMAQEKLQVNQPEFDLKEYLEYMKNDILQSIPQGQQTVAKASPTEATPTEEELEEMKEDFLNRFYANPIATIEEIATQKAQEKIRPFQEKEMVMEANQSIERFAQANPDFNELIPEIIQAIEERPYLQNNPRGLEDAYRIVKAGKLEQQIAATPMSADEMLQNENILNQILQNPEIKNKIIQQYIDEISKGQPPNLMTGNEGGKTVVTEGKKPTSLRESTEMFLKSMGMH